MKKERLLLNSINKALNGDKNFAPWGLCGLVETAFTLNKAYFLKTFVREPVERLGYDSGCPIFKIEPPENYVQHVLKVNSQNSDAQVAYTENSENLWDKKDPYCQRRIEVAKEIVKILENRLYGEVDDHIKSNTRTS